MTSKEVKIQRALGTLPNIADISFERLLRFRDKLAKDNEECVKDFDLGLYEEVLEEIDRISHTLSAAEEIDLLDKGLYPFSD